MSKKPVMACAECGPVINEPVSECPLYPGAEGHEVYWYDLAVGLEHEAAIISEMAELQLEARLLTDAANLIRAQQATIDSMQQAQGGAKHRRQEEKARRLAEVIRDYVWVFGEEPQFQDVPSSAWLSLVAEVNKRHPNDPINPPSDETKALVAAMFAQPQTQEAADV